MKKFDRNPIITNSVEVLSLNKIIGVFRWRWRRQGDIFDKEKGKKRKKGGKSVNM